MTPNELYRIEALAREMRADVMRQMIRNMFNRRPRPAASAARPA